MKVLLIDQIAKVNYKYSFNLANAIMSQGVDLKLIIDQKQEAEDCICERTQLFNTDEKNIGKIKKVFNYISSWRKIKKLMTEIDVLHTQWIIFSPMDYHYLKHIKNTGKRLVVTIHDILPFNQKFYDYHYHKKIYSLADQIIVQSPDNVNRFHELFPENKVPVQMIPHGHFLAYADHKDPVKSRESLGISEQCFTYLFFGQIKEVKGVDVLLEAFAKMLKEHKELRGKTKLVIAGSVWKADFGKCEEIIKREGIESDLKQDIRYIPDDEVGTYYAAADICVLPYREVYQSGVLQLTYAYHKVPILTKIPAFTDIVNEQRGFLCDPGDVDSLSEMLFESYEKRDALPDMAENGYKYIEERFDWGKIGKDIVNLYQSK